MHLMFPCVKCHKSCRKNQQSICCDSCNNWTHLRKCTNLNETEFSYLADSDDSYFCVKCNSNETSQSSNINNHQTINAKQSNATGSQSKSYLRFSCLKCNCACRKKQQAICCDACNNWIHRKCAELTNTEFDCLTCSDDTYYCSKCNSSEAQQSTTDNNQNCNVTNQISTTQNKRQN